MTIIVTFLVICATPIVTTKEKQLAQAGMKIAIPKVTVKIAQILQRGLVMNQATISDLIVAVMDAALAVTQDEELAAEITSRALVNILEKVSPGMARNLVEAFSDHTLH